MNKDYNPKHGEIKDIRIKQVLTKDYKELNDEFKTKPIDINEIRKMESPNKKTKRKLKKKIKNLLWTLLIIFFIALLIISVLKLLVWTKDNKETSKIIENINDDILIEELPDDDDTEIVNEEENKNNDYWTYIKYPLIDVDIKELKKKNSDTIGWINVNNTNVNYPYVQTSDNSYYLDHSFDKTYNEAGWVFMDYRNNSNLNNKNTILYAHSRLDKTMFGSLSKALKPNWYTNKDNHIIRISTETENSSWQIFSVYKIPEETYYVTTNFTSNEKYQEFLNTIKERSIHKFDTNLTTNDKILTLSTCYSETERTVIHAKLIKKNSKTQ